MRTPRRGGSLVGRGCTGSRGPSRQPAREQACGTCRPGTRPKREQAGQLPPLVASRLGSPALHKKARQQHVAAQLLGTQGKQARGPRRGERSTVQQPAVLVCNLLPFMFLSCLS